MEKAFTVPDCRRRSAGVIYDRALTLEKTWALMPQSGWQLEARPPSRRARALAPARMTQKPIPKRTP